MILNTKDNPLVSIVIPVYNTDKYLRRCIKSVINQTYNNLEIIIVDDGSTDKSMEICQEFLVHDKRIKLISKKNEGQAIARNIGIASSNGNYLGFVDSDDYIMEDMIESLLLNLIKYDADVSICGFYTDYIIKKKKNYSFPDLQIFNNTELMDKYINTPIINSIIWNKLYKKELWDNITFPEIRSKEDIFIMHELLGRAQKAIHIGECKYIQFVRPGSTEQSNFSLADLNLIYAVKKQQEYINANYPQLKKNVAVKLARTYINILRKIHSSFSYHEFHDLYGKLYEQLCNEVQFLDDKQEKNEFEYYLIKKEMTYKFYNIIIKGLVQGIKNRIKIKLILTTIRIRRL